MVTVIRVFGWWYIGRCIGRCRIVRHDVGRYGVGRYGIGPIMIGPYAFRLLQPFPYHHDPVHMVGHHHERIDVHMRHVFRYGIPTPLRQFADGRSMHYTIRNVSKQMASVIGTDGQVTYLSAGRYAPCWA